jgi:hypothetical protein
MSSLVKEKPAKLKIGGECPICCEPYTGTVREPIECKACDHVACKNCVKTYLLQISEPKCMQCNVQWTDEFCNHVLGSFMNTKHRKYMKTLLFEMEKARFPETMPAVETHLAYKKATEDLIHINSIIDDARRALNQLHDEKNRLLNVSRNLKYGKKKPEATKKFIRACPVNDCEGFLSTAWKCGVCETWACSKCFEIIGKDKNVEHVCNEDTLKSAQMIKNETKPCPSCSAAIYKIEGCDQMWCTQCKVAFSWRTGLKVTGTIHNPHYYQWMKENKDNVMQPGAQICGGLPGLTLWRNVISTIKSTTPMNELFSDMGSLFIHRNTFFRRFVFHSNPLCHVRHGYDPDKKQLYLRVSPIHTPASFNRNNNSTISVIPKKYYYQLPKEEWENMLNDDNNKHRTINRASPYVLMVPPSIVKLTCIIGNIHNLLQSINHFDNVELYDQRQKCQLQQDNQDLRIKFIIKETTEKNMKIQLMKRKRKHKKENKILQIYELFSQVTGECCRNIVNQKTIETMITNWEKIERVRKYCNFELLKISETFNQVVPLITLAFRHFRLNSKTKENPAQGEWGSSKGWTEGGIKYLNKEDYINRKLYHDTKVYTNLSSTHISDEQLEHINIYDIQKDDIALAKAYIQACIWKRQQRF